MSRKNRVWSRAVISERPQCGWMTKRVIPARRARRTIAGLPTMSRTRVAAMLSDRRIIGREQRLLAGVERPVAHARLAQVGDQQHRLDHARRRELAVQPAARETVPVRTANVTDPWRADAHAAAPATSGCQRSSATADAGHSRPTSTTAAARRRIASVYGA